MVDSFDNTFVTISWEQPLANGGQALTGFKVYSEDCSNSLSVPVLLSSVPST